MFLEYSFFALLFREILSASDHVSVLRALTYTSITNTIALLEGKERERKFVQSNKSLNDTDKFWRKTFVLFPCRLR